MTGESLEKNRGIFYALRHRAHLVEGTRERRNAVATNAPVAGLYSDAVAKARRLTDRAARIRSERRDAHVAADSRRASARRATWNTRQIVGIARNGERRILGRGAHGELVHIYASTGNEAVSLHVRYDGRVIWRYVSFENLRAARAGLSAYVDKILHRDRYGLGIGFGELKCALLVESDVCADIGVLLAVTRDNGLDDVLTRKIALFQTFSRLGNAQLI